MNTSKSSTKKPRKKFWERPSEEPDAYRRRFGGIEPMLALALRDVVQRECRDRYYGSQRVDVVIMDFGRNSEPRFGRAQGFLILAAGDWLHDQGWRIMPRMMP